MKTPIIDEILKLKLKTGLSFHTPGHKNGQVLSNSLKEIWPKEIWPFDLTEIDKLDNLHFPQGCIQESQRLTAEFFGARESFFLINGTTVGIEAAIMALAYKKPIFVPRNVHKSIYNGAIIANSQIISMPVTFDKKLDIPLGLEPEVLERYIRKNPSCKTIVLPNPNYQGISYKVEKNIEIAQRYGIKIILDEAHGSHFMLSDFFPKAGLTLGADLVIQSWHKTLPALTQASVLHVNSNYEGPHVRSYLNLLQSTSPSYLLLASLDGTRAFLQEARENMENIINKILSFKKSLSALNNIKIGIDTKEPQDPLKLCVSSTKITGYQLEELLREQYGIYGELAAENYVLFILGLTKDNSSLDKLRFALEEINQMTDNFPERDKPSTKKNIDILYQQKMNIQKAFHSEKERLPIRKCLGRICGQFIIKYPPGIPYVIPGEEITTEIIDSIEDFTIEVVVCEGNRGGINR